MFKVVIVDDEIYVVALIQKLIQWDKYQMKVEATANDGMTALSLVKEVKPNLVIVDVRMPGYDGIAFMDEVRKFNTNVKFIVISGHKQFDYAKGAMRNNVEDYLLKPINKEELETVIRHVYDQLMENREKESRIKEMAVELDTSKGRVRETFLKTLLAGEQKLTDVDFVGINERNLISLQPGCFRILALFLDSPAGEQPSTREDNLLLEESCANLRGALQEVCWETVEYTYKNVCFFFLNYRESSRQKIREILREQLSKCTLQVKKFENLFFRICMGAESSAPLAWESSVESLWNSSFARTALPGGRIIEPEDIRKTQDLLPAILEYREDKFSQALSSLNAEEIHHCIKEMYSRAFYGIEEDSLLYYRLFVELLNRTYRYFKDIGICKELELEFRNRLLEAYMTASGPREYAAVLYREISHMIEENQLSARSQATPTIRIVKRYIAEHYREDISLSSAAGLVNLTPVYLSRLFKKEEGINFVDYLNQYRIDVSKNLLRDVKYNVLDVAELSGFSNTRYFSKIFKKAVGITPSEYRKRHSGKDEE